MRRAISESVSLAVIASALLALVVSIRPGDRDLALDLYVLVVGALAMLAVSRVARLARESQAGRSRFDEALAAEPSAPERPPDLVRLEREVALSVARAFDLHFRLRPALREIAVHRLLARRGIDLHERPEAARAALGEPAWELLREDRPAPEDRMGPGLPLDELRRVVDTLERV